MGNIVETWADDSYYRRDPTHIGDLTLCELVDEVYRIRERQPVGRAQGIFQLARFRDSAALPWNVADPDSAAVQMLAAALLGVDGINQFARIWREGESYTDLATAAPRLWASYGPDRSVAAVNAVIGWRHQVAHFTEMAFGDPHGECAYPPGIANFGQWQEGIPQGLVGVWFAFAHTGEHAGGTETVTLGWSELGLPTTTPVDPVLIDFATERFLASGAITVEPGVRVTWRIPAPSCVAGRLIWHVDPASADQVKAPRAVDIVVQGSPGRSGAKFYVSSPGTVEVSVFDVSGRLVRRLGQAGGEGPPMIEWDGRDEGGRMVQAGVYLARGATASGDARTCRVVVVQ